MAVVSDEFWRNLGPIVTAVSLLITAIGTLVNMVMNRRNRDDIKDVKRQTNGMMDERLAEARKSTRIETRRETLRELRDTGWQKLSDESID